MKGHLFSRFLKYTVPYIWRAIVGVGFNLVGTLFSLFSFTMVIPFLGILFDNQKIVAEPVPFAFTTKAIQHNFNYFLSEIIVQQGAHNALLVVSLMVVSAVLAKSGFAYAANYIIVPLRSNVVRDIRNAMHDKILALPMGYFSQERKGDIISRVIGDVKELEGTVVQSIKRALKAPIELIIYLVALFLMSMQFTLFVLVLLPLSGFLISRIAKKLRKQAEKGQESLGAILVNVEETLFGMRIIKAFNAEKSVARRFQDENEIFTQLMNKVWRRKYMAHPLSELVGTMVIVVVMWFGGSLVLNQESALSPQEFIAYLVIFSQIIPPAKVVSNLYFDVQKGMASFSRIDSLLQTKIKIKNHPRAIAIPEFKESITYDNVNFRYAEKWVLKDINFTIRKGQTVALVGQSGAGKSTFVDLLPRFYDVEHGTIFIDGKPLPEYDIGSLRQLIGLVSQEQILFNDTIYNNIAFGISHAKEADVVHAAKVANAHDFIMQTEQGYQTVVGDRGSKLSGGQRQRVTIARAILKNPPILILDEATSALDAESEKLVQAALNQLMQNRTSIVIAHRLSTIRNADVVCVLKDGLLIEHGRHDELLASGGAFKKLYEQQFS